MRKLLLAFCLIGNLAHAGELIDRIVAVVNDDVIMLSELGREAQELSRQLQRNNTATSPARDQVLSTALDRLILAKLQLAEARRLGIAVEEEAVTRATMSMSQKSNLSLLRFRSLLAEEGIDFDQFQQHIREKLIISRLINREVNSQIQVTKTEVAQQLNKIRSQQQNQARLRFNHIMLALPIKADRATQKAVQDQALKIRTSIRSATNFPKVAANLPAGQNQGNSGWVNADQLPAIFINNLQNTKVGDIVGPFRSAQGYHLLQLTGYREASDKNAITSQILARHILIRTDANTGDQNARGRLQQLHKRIQAGEDFASLARSYSADPGSAIKGGDLGWASPNDMVPAFAEKLQQTAINTLSEPFKTRFGWHIIEVMGKREHDSSAHRERQLAREMIQTRKSEEATLRYLQRLRAEAYIDVRSDDS